MQRHLAESHTPPKPKKPLPSLIPLNIASSKPNTANSGPPSTLLKVPRVRVRPELAQIARDTELAKMYGNKVSFFYRKPIDFFSRQLGNTI